MFKEYFANHELLAYPMFALVFFVVVFTSVVITVMRRKPEAIDAMARLPLSEDVPEAAATKPAGRGASDV